jgi:hypothetical protein
VGRVFVWEYELRNISQNQLHPQMRS